ncbi:MAG: RidA family protein [Rhodospirillales bacterium]|jgi:2-iminobutanoate/2-iminopropanoate deaminase|nr:RidA family protein [Rhodospirillales bacterium]
MRIINPSSVHPPVAAYSHAIEVPAQAKRLIVSGQLGLRPDGTVPKTAKEQSEQAWRNLLAILEDAGYGLGDVVRLRIFATDARDLPAVRAVRDQFLGDHRPASTLVVIAGLAKPEYVFEMEAEAVRIEL